jgi:hypothetical protein
LKGRTLFSEFQIAILDCGRPPELVKVGGTAVFSFSAFLWEKHLDAISQQYKASYYLAGPMFLIYSGATWSFPVAGMYTSALLVGLTFVQPCYTTKGLTSSILLGRVWKEVKSA